MIHGRWWRMCGDLASAFEKHLEIFGRLDICINNAGVGNEISFVQDKSTDGSGEWRRTIDINLMALIDCTRLARVMPTGDLTFFIERERQKYFSAVGQSHRNMVIKAMQAGGHHGTILNIGSASGLYPSYDMPVYSASKGGVVMFSRSLTRYKRKGIRVNVLCPEVTPFAW
eukprot:Gb_28193 [translate_table: standard]